VRIARFSVDDEPRYGVVETDDPEGLVGTVNVLDSDPLYRSAQFTGEKLQLADVRLLAPVIPRSKVVCVGRNYAAHAAELGNDVPKEPMIFLKPNTSVIGPRDGIVYPEQTNDLHFEGELAIVIGRAGRHIPVARALDHVAGYTCFVDGSVRDYQKFSVTSGKNFPGTGPLGPWIVTTDEIPDPTRLTLTTRLNGAEVQKSGTDLLIYSVPQIIAFCSDFTPLVPGDVIATGTPDGVGHRRTPPLWMKPGDVLEVEISGIGTLRNRVVDET